MCLKLNVLDALTESMLQAPSGSLFCSKGAFLCSIGGSRTACSRQTSQSTNRCSNPRLREGYTCESRCLFVYYAT